MGQASSSEADNQFHRVIHVVHNSDTGAPYASNLVKEAPNDHARRSQVASIVAWLRHTENASPRLAQLAEVLAELDRFGVDYENLNAVGYHGERLARLLRSYRTGWTEQATGQSASGVAIPWTRAILDYRLLSPIELATLASRAAPEASFIITDWRSPTIDPITRRTLHAFTSAGFRTEGSFSAAVTPAIETAGYHFADPDDEVAWVLSELVVRLHHGDIAYRDIAIYLPQDPTYQRALRHYSHAFCLPVLASQTKAAPTTSLGRHLGELIELIQRDHVVGSTQREPQLRSLLGNLRKLPQPEGDWDVFIEWLWDAMEQLEAHPKLSAQRTVFDQGLPEALLTLLAELRPEASATTPTNDFLANVQEALHSVFVAGQRELDGITVAPTGSPIRPHRVVAVLGATDGLFPPAMQDHPILPLAVRDQIDGLPTTAELVQHQRVTSIGMLQSATEHLLITGAKRVGNNRTLQSLLLTELGVALKSAPPRHGIRASDRAASGSAPSPLRARLERGSLLELERIQSTQPSQFSGMTGPLGFGELSATQLEDLGQCPFRWLVKHRLRAQPPDRETNEPDARELGQLVHSILELLVTEHGSMKDRSALEDLLEMRAPASLTERTPNWPAIRREMAQQLLTLTANPEFVPSTEHPLIELELHGDWYDIPVVGRIDRLDEVSPAAFRIIDYKYSRSAPLGIQDSQGVLKVDVQLSVYTQLVRQQRGQVISAKYCLVKKGEFVKPKGSSKGEDPAIEAAKRLRAELVEGQFEVAPDLNHHACDYCDFRQVCRIASKNAG